MNVYKAASRRWPTSVPIYILLLLYYTFIAFARKGYLVRGPSFGCVLSNELSAHNLRTTVLDRLIDFGRERGFVLESFVFRFWGAGCNSDVTKPKKMLFFFLKKHPILTNYLG